MAFQALQLFSLAWLANAQPPIIDIADLVTGKSEDNVVISKISTALEDWGFFQIINHGIPLEVELDLSDSMIKFFASPSEVKNSIRRSLNNSRGFADNELTKQRMDLKEIFDVGHKPFPMLDDSAEGNVVLDGFNQWPTSSDLPFFRTSVEKYFDECAALARTLTKALLSNGQGDLDLIKEGTFHHLFDNHSSFLRLNYYPPNQCVDDEAGSTDEACALETNVEGGGHPCRGLSSDRSHSFSSQGKMKSPLE